MKRSDHLLTLGLLCCLSLLAACSSNSGNSQPESGTVTANPAGHGTLEGQVTVGPLMPVVRQGVPEPTPAPEVYAARQIVIFDEGGEEERTRVSIDANGHYQTELPAGTYVVDINHVGIDSAAGLPATVNIQSGQVTVLNIDVDTGIR
jgi:hypothetical protein